MRSAAAFKQRSLIVLKHEHLQLKPIPYFIETSIYCAICAHIQQNEQYKNYIDERF